MAGAVERSRRNHATSHGMSLAQLGFARERTRRYPSWSHHRRLCHLRESAGGRPWGGSFT